VDVAAWAGRVASLVPSVELLGGPQVAALGDADQLVYASKPNDLYAPFGRSPHRNALPGRAPRPDEIAAGDVFPW
jgi:uncharacterized protein (DUF924 family)